MNQYGCDWPLLIHALQFDIAILGDEFRSCSPYDHRLVVDLLQFDREIGSYVG